MIYSPDGLMRYNNGKIAIVDDIPLLLQWIKKSTCFHKSIFWSRWQDSNLRHLAPKASAQPTGRHLDRNIKYEICRNLPKSALVALLRCPKVAFRLWRGQLLTAALRYARCIIHRMRSQPHPKQAQPAGRHLDSWLLRPVNYIKFSKLCQ